jgi:hypothetical protein
MRRIKKQNGFIAITSVLIISALILILGISIFHASITDQAMSSSYDDGEEASFLAVACARIAFFKLKENIDYAGDETVDINGMSCSINTIENVNDRTKIISTLARVGDRPSFKRVEEEIKYVVESKAEDWICGDEDCAIENLKIVNDSLVLQEKLIEGEEIEKATRTTAFATEWLGENNYASTSGLKTDGDDLVLEDNQTSGYRISNPFSLGEVKYAGDSNIEWVETLEADTEINIYTQVVYSEVIPTEATGTWLLATNGQPIPEIERSTDLTNYWLWVKQELKTQDVALTPRLHVLTEKILEVDLVPVETEGSRISSELDISGEGVVKDSQIFWDKNTRLNASIIVETRLLIDEIWTGWEFATNGREIPGLIKGTNLEEVFIQTRTTFTGGPKFYPSLNSINIFIETK